MKIMKKYVAIAAAAILLAGVVYFSCSLNKGKKPVNADADAMPQATGDSVAANENFFEAFREERESTRSLEIEYLDEILWNSDNITVIYQGTLAQWKEITIRGNSSKNATIICTDGETTAAL